MVSSLLRALLLCSLLRLDTTASRLGFLASRWAGGVVGRVDAVVAVVGVAVGVVFGFGVGVGA